jgi:hypothetical protein
MLKLFGKNYSPSRGNRLLVAVIVVLLTWTGTLLHDFASGSTDQCGHSPAAFESNNFSSMPCKLPGHWHSPSAVSRAESYSGMQPVLGLQLAQTVVQLVRVAADLAAIYRPVFEIAVESVSEFETPPCYISNCALLI